MTGAGELPKMIDIFPGFDIPVLVHDWHRHVAEITRLRAELATAEARGAETMRERGVSRLTQRASDWDMCKRYAQADEARECVTALRALAPPAAAGSPWRTNMQEARRYGDEVLLWGPLGHGHVVAQWDDGSDRERIYSGQIGWHALDGFVYPEAFTHWMPLPPPPLASLPPAPTTGEPT